MIRYEDIASSIQVRHLQVGIDEALRFGPDEAAAGAEAALLAHGYDQAPVIDGDQIVGTVRRVDLAGASTVGDAYRALQPAELVSADAPVSNLLGWLLATPCLYVLDGRKITGFVVEADLNKQPARVYYYLLIATLELALAQRLRDWMARDEGRLRAAMGDDAFDKVDARRSEARDHDVDTDLIAYMTFLEIVRTAGRITEIRTQFGYRSRTRWKSVEGLNILRNAVMHPTKSLITPTRPLARLAERDRLLRSLLSQASELAPLTVGASRAEPLSP